MLWPSICAAEPCCGRDRRRYESVAVRCCGHEFRSAATIFAGEASKFVSLVFKPGASSSHADDADGAGRVSGTQRLLYPVGSLLNAAEQQTTGAHIWSQALKPSFRLSRSTARRS